MVDLTRLLAQLLVVLTAARLGGWLARRVGQSAVIGEMAAGIALGPSLLGTLAPDASRALFPASSLAPLATLSQLGVLLFMFVVGLRLELGVLRGQTRAAVATSNVSIALPFLLGLAIAPRLHPELAGAGVSLRAFALFVGAAMSVTAFPVLARIIADRNLGATRVGIIAIAAAAVDDVSAWCILAAVVALARAGNGLWPAVTAVVSIAAYALAMIFVGRPLLGRLFATRAPGLVTPPVVGLAVLVAFASALATESLGAHALFGAFLAGTLLPRTHNVAREIADKLESPVAVVLVPIFFAFTGLRTSIGLVSGAAAWGLCALIIAAAVVGKLGGSAVAARLAGNTWRDAISIGALMNTRGLMELVILGIGLDAGVISPTLFAMMVVMALVTTLMTAPLLTLTGVTAPRVAVP